MMVRCSLQNNRKYTFEIPPQTRKKSSIVQTYVEIQIRIDIRNIRIDIRKCQSRQNFGVLFTDQIYLDIHPGKDGKNAGKKLNKWIGANLEKSLDSIYTVQTFLEIGTDCCAPVGMIV